MPHLVFALISRCFARYSGTVLGRAKRTLPELVRESRGPSIRLIAIRLLDTEATRGHGGQIAPGGALGSPAAPSLPAICLAHPEDFRE